MKKSKLLPLGLAAVITFSPVSVGAQELAAPPAGKVFSQGGAWVWAIFGCSSGVILSAMVANWRNNRQLTWNEAASCGLLYWLSPQKPRKP